MSLKRDIVNAQQEAMKTGEKEKLSVLRLLVSAIKNEEIEKKRELTDDEVMSIVQKQVKQTKEAIVDFTKGERKDLVEQANKEIEFLSVYLPAELSEEELEKKVSEILSLLDADVNIGQAMGKVMGELKGLVEGGRVKQMIEKILSNK